MFTIFVVKIHYFLETQTILTHIALLAQIFNVLIVFALFEHHWVNIHSDAHFEENRPLIRKLDKATYDTFRFIFILFSFAWIYVLARTHIQKYDSARFVSDYGLKRSW